MTSQERRIQCALTEVEERKKKLVEEVVLPVDRTELLHSLPVWVAAANSSGFKQSINKNILMSPKRPCA